MVGRLQERDGLHQVAEAGAVGAQQLLDVQQHPLDLSPRVARVNRGPRFVDAGRSRDEQQGSLGQRHFQAAGEGGTVVGRLVERGRIHDLDLRDPGIQQGVQIERASVSSRP